MRISDWSSDVCSSDLPDGRVLAGGSKRLWPQCEGVKAALAVYERCGDEAALAAARHLLGGLFATFADLNRPDWREQVDRDGGTLRPALPSKIGRAARRERMGHDVLILVASGSLKKKKNIIIMY